MNEDVSQKVHGEAQAPRKPHYRLRAARRLQVRLPLALLERDRVEGVRRGRRLLLEPLDVGGDDLRHEAEPGTFAEITRNFLLPETFGNPSHGAWSQWCVYAYVRFYLVRNFPAMRSECARNKRRPRQSTGNIPTKPGTQRVDHGQERAAEAEEAATVDRATVGWRGSGCGGGRRGLSERLYAHRRGFSKARLLPGVTF